MQQAAEPTFDEEMPRQLGDRASASPIVEAVPPAG
jgi:hypothetical protein